MTAAVEVVVRVEDVDLASGLLWGSGVSAISESELDGDLVVLTTDVPMGGIDAVEAVLGGRWPMRLVDVADDGLDGWRPYAEVVRAGRHVVVQPPWIAFDAEPEDVVLRIDPGRSFGHGAHPTTRLCLAEVERSVRPGIAMLDVGCGSGVLAIAAARLGAERVVAVDIDPGAIAATAANATANGVAIDVSATPVSEVAGRFDLVVANIGSATIVDLADAMAERAASGGAIVLSGLLADRWQDVVTAFDGWAVVMVAQLDGWVATTMERP